MAAPIEIDVWHGEIAELEVDALVVGSSESLFMTAAAAASVKRMGGTEIENAAVAQGPIEPGRAVATAGGHLAAPYVIHAVAVGHDRRADADRLCAAVKAALAYCEPLRLHRIAVAPIGTEYGVFRVEEAAELLIATLLAAAPLPLESVVVAVAHPTEARVIADALERLRGHGVMGIDPARQAAEELERHGLATPARLLADAHRPLGPLLADLGVVIGPLARAIGGVRAGPLTRWLEDPTALDRLVVALDEGEQRAEPG